MATLPVAVGICWRLLTARQTDRKVATLTLADQNCATYGSGSGGCCWLVWMVVGWRRSLVDILYMFELDEQLWSSLFICKSDPLAIRRRQAVSCQLRDVTRKFSLVESTDIK